MTTLRSIGQTQIPDSIGGVELFHSVATAGVEGEISVEAETAGQTELTEDTVIIMVGVDRVEILARRCSVAVGHADIQSYLLLAYLPVQFKPLGQIGRADGGFLRLFTIHADHISIVHDRAVSAGADRELLLRTELQVECITCP